MSLGRWGWDERWSKEAAALEIDPRARAAALADRKSALKTLQYHPKYKDRS